MRIGFTGTQKGMTTWQELQLWEQLERLGCTEFVFGDCIGADIEAATLALLKGIKIFTVYPQNKDTRKRAWFGNPSRRIDIEGKDYLDAYYITEDSEFAGVSIKWMPAEPPLSRNMRIVDNCDWVIATPKEFEHTLRSGTWQTIRYAWKHKKDKVTIIPPEEHGCVTIQRNGE